MPEISLEGIPKGHHPFSGGSSFSASPGPSNLCTSAAVWLTAHVRCSPCRERAAKMYARASYITPYIIAQTLVFVPVVYFMVGKHYH